MLEILKAAFYGIVQGLTEFLPVSSSGHLAVLKNWFGLEFDDAVLFTLILHLGSLAAVIIIYRKDISDLIANFVIIIIKIFTKRFKYKKLNQDERFAVLIFIATLPLVIGALISSRIEFLTERTRIVGLFLIINSVILLFSDGIPKGDVSEKTVSPKNALFVGLCQLIAVVPGISRSGMTITGGLLTGFDRRFAVKFSFIMSVPAILGASVFKIIGFAASDNRITGVSFAMCLTGLIFAFITGVAAIFLVNVIARKKNFAYFAVYCFVFGLLALIFG